jgi:hypothetical protein
LQARRGDGAGNKWRYERIGGLPWLSRASDFDVDAETNRVLDVALEMTRAALGLADDFANGIIARQIVELARAGERNPDLLCEGALKKLRGALFGD